MFVVNPSDNSLQEWDLNMKEQLSSVALHNTGFSCVAAVANAKHLYLGYQNGVVEVWCIRTKTPVRTIKGRYAALSGLLLTDKFLFMNHTVCIKVWNIEKNWEMPLTFSPDTNAACICMAVHENHMVVGVRTCAIAWSLANVAPLSQHYHGLYYTVGAVSVANGIAATCTKEYGVIHLWNVSDGVAFAHLQDSTHTFTTLSLNLCAYPGFLVSHDSASIKIWSLSRRKCISTIPRSEDQGPLLQVLPMNDRILCTGEEGVSVLSDRTYEDMVAEAEAADTAMQEVAAEVPDLVLPSMIHGVAKEVLEEVQRILTQAQEQARLQQEQRVREETEQREEQRRKEEEEREEATKANANGERAEGANEEEVEQGGHNCWVLLDMEGNESHVEPEEEGEGGTEMAESAAGKKKKCVIQ